VIGGGLAAQAAQPDWIATAELTLHLAGAVTSGSVEARARVAHAGRTTVVIEVTLHDDAGAEFGLATMSFARLSRRDGNPDISSGMTSGPSSMALPESRLQGSLVDELGIRVVDVRQGIVEAPVLEWSRNSLGAMQGGAVAVVVDAAVQAVADRPTAGPVVVTDLQLTYLALARVGPVRTLVEVLGIRPGVVTARVAVVDAGAGGRLTTVGRVVATTSPAGT
jgi:acyl-coenzyme A thioesterase PaaI-like protein